MTPSFLRIGFGCLLILWTLCSGNAQVGYFPMRTAHSLADVRNFSSSLLFPEYPGGPGGNCGISDARNLAGPIQFLNLSGVLTVLIGGAGGLYLLDGDTLRCHNKYEEPSNQTDVNQCRSAMDDHSGCFNFLSVYARFPSSGPNATRMLVCGTNAGVRQTCRVVDIRDRMFNVPTSGQTVDAPFGLVSLFPQLGGFGEFRELDGSTSDSTFFSAGFYRLPDVSRDIGRNYNITFQTVSYDEETFQLSLDRNLSMRDDQNWWNFPVEFVQYLKVSYTPAQPLDPGQTLDFYYVFLREGVIRRSTATNEDEMKISYVMRLCQNDPGVGDVFSTMLKARIYCEREAPQDLLYVGSVDYRYNEINAVSLSDPNGGRFWEQRSWSRYMYAAFSGPQIGPAGTAICVYHDNVVSADNPTGFNQGLYSIFLEDVVRAPGLSPATTPNNYFECRPEGRPADSINDVNINIDFAQIGEDPLIVLDGILVVKMLVDHVCVVQKDNSRSCKNQDIFFVGTDLGRVMKIALATVNSRTFQTVVAEEFVVDEDSYVTDMSFQTVGSMRRIFVSTNTSLHSIPLERCSRLQGCRDCIGARDPYCVWNNNTRTCEATSLIQANSGQTPVPTHIWQNIHTGRYPDCEVDEVCSVQAVVLNTNTIRCIAGCNFTSLPINISVNSLTTSLRICPDVIAGYELSACEEFELVNGLGLHSYSCLAQSRYSDRVTTPPGLPAGFENDVYASCDQTSCEICVQQLQLTDDIDSYTIQVVYTAAGRSEMRTPVEMFQSSNGCVHITSLTPGSTVSYRIIISNSVDSTTSNVQGLKLLDGEAGPVLNIAVHDVTNSSIQVSWQEPAILNGTLVGYSVLANGISEQKCSSQATAYTVENLFPYTNYTIEIRACNNYGESTQSARVLQQTACGIPSMVRNSSVAKTGTDLNYSWDTPDKYNGDISQELYQVNLECFKVGLNGISHTTRVPSRSILLSDYIPVGNFPRTLCCAQIQAVTECNRDTILGIPYVLCGTTDDTVPDQVVNLTANESYVGTDSFVLEWKRPINYDSPGLNYKVEVSNHSAINISQQFLFVGGLSPCTEYNVQVTAMNSELDSSETNSLMVTTRPALPPSPINLKYSYDNVNDALSLTWNIPNSVCRNQTILNYIVTWSCNGFQNPIIYNTSNMSVVLSLNVNFGLCFTTVQSCDDYDRCSAFSEQVTVEATRQPPPTLECYSYTELLNDVRVAFLFPSSFITSQLRIKWNLINYDTGVSMNESYEYSSVPSNVVNLTTQSNSQYSFSISACNVFGCGDPCLSNFSTSAIPFPPNSIEVSDIQSSSALLSWNHFNTGRKNFSYGISISSSCPEIASHYIDNIISTSYKLQGLCPNDNYSVVILAVDNQVNQKSVYSTPVLFATKHGVPSEPRFIVASISQSKGLYVTWHPPRYLNSQISHYLVKWVKLTSCISDSKSTMMVQNDQYNYEFADFQEDISEITVCVQAVALNNVSGPWGSDVRLTSQALTSEPSCTTLYIVIVFVSIAGIVALIMLILFGVSLFQCYKYSNCNKKQI